MGIFIKHILRNIKENVGRTILIIFLLFGVSSLLFLMVTFGFCFKSFLDALLSMFSGTADYTVYSVTDDELNLERLNLLGYEFDGFGIGESNYGYVVFDDEFLSLSLMGLDVSKAEKMKFIDSMEDDNFVLNNNDVMVFESYAQIYGYKKGSKIQYYDESGRIHDLIVKYIISDSLTFEGVGLITNEETFLNICGDEKNLYSEFYVNYLGEKKIDVLTEELDEIEYEYGLNFEEKMSINTEELLLVFENVIKIIVIIFVLLLVIVYFTLNSIVKIIINERIPIIGAFRSVGATVGKMNFILLLEMTVYGLVGGALGAIFSSSIMSLINLILVSISQYLFNVTIQPISFSQGVWLFVAAISFMVVFQICLSIMEIMKSTKISIKECIFNKHETVYKYSINKKILGIFFLALSVITLIFYEKINFLFGIIGILSLFFAVACLLPSITRKLSKLLDKFDNPVVKMAKNTVVNNKLLINTNIITVVMMSICLVAFSVYNYYEDVFEGKINLFNSDLYVKISDELELMDTANIMRNIDGIEGVSILYSDNVVDYYFSLSFANNNLSELKIMYSDNYKTLLEDSNLINVDADLANNLVGNEIIVSNYLRDKYNLKVGDVVVLKGIIEEKNFTVEDPYNMKIVGFADTSKVSYYSIIVSEDLLDKLNKDMYRKEYFIRLMDQADINEIKKELKKVITATAPIITDVSEYNLSIKMVLKGLSSLIITVISIIIGISLVGIINNQSVSFFKRKREMAMLYSTSMSREQINKMILIESLSSYLVSAMVSFGLSIILINLVKFTLEYLELYIPMSISMTSILVLLLAVGVIMVVIYLVMRIKIRKMNVVEELKYE